MSRIRCLILCCITLLVSVIPALSQDWTHSNTLIMQSYRTAYFITPELGFTYFSGVSHVGGTSMPMAIGSSPNLERTTDGGVTWTAITTDFDKTFSSMDDLYFDSPSHGYAAIARWAGGIYETYDTGTHWKKISNGD